MGLDISFYKAKRSKFEETRERIEEINDLINKEYSKTDGTINSKYVSELSLERDKIDPLKEVAYFREYNFLLPFFEYEENCSKIEIKKCQVENFIEVCSEVLANHNKAMVLLPIKNYFSLSIGYYDNWYFEWVKNAKIKFKCILASFNSDEDVLIMNCDW